MTEHKYKLNINWTGNLGTGTSDYRSYSREHVISTAGKPDIPASSDPAFRGDKTRYNPEELFLASISGCHLLWFLHLCADSQIVVTQYEDNPVGFMTEDSNGGGKFTEVTLYPKIKIDGVYTEEKINELHRKAGEMCFIANSLNFEVKVVNSFM
jgi:organic hydroperoxide reductase OsmC/OhrA